MDAICSYQCLPDLLVIDGEKGWNSSCSLGLLSIGFCLWMLTLAAKPGWFRTFLGWDWMTDHQRRIGFLLLAPTMLLGGLGAYDHDAAWMLIGYGLATAGAIFWQRRCRRGPTNPT